MAGRGVAHPRTAVGGAAAALVLLIPLSFSTTMHAGFWSLKVPLVLTLAALGLPSLPAIMRSPYRRCALAGVGFLGIAVVASLLSDQPLLSLVGLYNWGTGSLFVGVLVGAWAVGASLSPSGRAAIASALLLAGLVNAVIGAVGSFSDFYVLRLGIDGRAQGLMGNPGAFGVLLAMALVLVLDRFRHRPTAWAGPLVVLAAGIQLSGSRGPLLASVGATAAFAVILRRRWRVGLAAGALFGAGIAVALLLPSPAGATAATARLSAGPEAGGAARLLTWKSAAPSVAAHPLLGVGPGRFRQATSPQRTYELALAEGPDRLFVDAHNLVVEYLTTTGIIGVVALGFFIALSLRSATGPFLGVAVVGLVLHLVEPQSIGTTPLVFLALGASLRPLSPRSDAPWSRCILVTFALVSGTVLLLGDFTLEQARLDYDLEKASMAARLLAPWPEPISFESRVHLLRAIEANEDPAEVAAARAARYRAIRRDPSDPGLRNDAGELDLAYGHAEDAARQFGFALALNPWSRRALIGLGRARFSQERYGEAGDLLSRASSLEETPRLRSLLDEARRRATEG